MGGKVVRSQFEDKDDEGYPPSPPVVLKNDQLNTLNLPHFLKLKLSKIDEP